MAPAVQRAVTPVTISEIVTRLEAMTPAQRLDASRTALGPHERAVWAARYPEEMPLVNGEYEWIALLSADCD
jgi:hypothetical protein